MTAPLLAAIAGLAALSGRVTDPSGAPVPGAHVKAYESVTEVGVQLDAARTTESGADGAFTLTDLARGTYVLQVSAPGLAPVELTSIRAPGRAVDVKLSKGVPLKGAVYDAATRALLADALVEVHAQNDLPDALVSGKTGKRGEIAIPALSSGTYDVIVKARGYAPESRTITVGGGEPPALNVSLDKGAIVEVLVQGEGDPPRPVEKAVVTLACASSGQSARADASGSTGKDGKAILESAPACGRYLATVHHAGWRAAERVPVVAQAGKDAILRLSVKLERGVGISGRVLDDKGGPVGGAAVWASCATSSGSTHSAQDGAFRIDGLEAGQASLWATADGYIQAQDQEIELASKGLSGITLTLRSGRSVKGSVHDQEKQAVGGAEITVDAQETESVGVSDGSGQFQIGGIGDGELTLRVWAPGFQPLTQKSESVSDIDLVLQKGAAIRGRVLDGKSGEGVAGGQVYVMPIAAEGGADMQAMDEYQHGSDEEDSFGAKTGGGGEFEISGLRAGSYTLMATAPGYVYGVAPEIAVAEGQAHEGVVLKLDHGSTISGTVVREKDGAPIPGAQVAIEEATGFTEIAPVFTDAAGRFRLTGLSGQRATLSASHPDYASREATFTISEGVVSADAILKLSSGCRLKGIVLAGGTPVSGAQVGVEGNSTVTDGAGAFDLEHLPAGLVRVYVTAPYRGEGSTPSGRMQDVTVAEGESASVVIDLEAGTRLSGRLLHAGKPVSEGNVSIQDDSGWGPMATVNADGTFVLKGARPGPCRIMAMATNLRMQKEITVPDQDTEITLEFPASGVKGVVVEAGSGKPMGGASVYANAGEALGFGTPTTADGAFELSAVPPGTYDLHASLEGYKNATVPVTVADGQVLDGVRIELSKHSDQSTTLVGKVAFADGRPAFPSMVTMAAGGDVENEVMTDGSGRFSIPEVAAGTYDIVAVQPGSGYGPAIRLGLVVGDATPSVDLVLPREATLKVTVRRGGNPLPGAAVVLQAPQMQALLTMLYLQDETDRDGVAHLAGLPAGAFTVKVTVGMESRETPVALEVGRQSELVIAF